MKIDDRARSRRARRFARQTFFLFFLSLIGYVTRGTKTPWVAPAQLVSTTKEKNGPYRTEDSALRCLPRFFVITRRR